MKSKLIALLLVLAMCFSLLTACGSGSSAPSQAQSSSSAAQSSSAVPAQPEAASASSAEESADASAPAAEEVEVPEIDPDAPEAKIGMLSILNLSETDAAQMLRARKLATAQLLKEGDYTLEASENPDKNGKITVTYYDSLDAMLMALKAGQLTSINVTDSVADYLLLTNPDLVEPMRHNPDSDNSTFAEMMGSGLVGEGYSFMMMEDHAQLRDEFDEAISAMKEDGTLDRLVKEQITDVMNGKDPVEIELPPIPDAETIQVAVTGALPPMDYVGPLGMPVGFSTAVLAEISTRINKNISVSVIDSGARASVLASGQADVVFWTRTSSAASEVKAMSEEERNALGEGLTDEELTVIKQINSIYDFTTIADMDVPEGTIVTQPYYSGYNLPVLVKP